MGAVEARGRGVIDVRDLGPRRTLKGKEDLRHGKAHLPLGSFEPHCNCNMSWSVTLHASSKTGQHSWEANSAQAGKTTQWDCTETMIYLREDGGLVGRLVFLLLMGCPFLHFFSICFLLSVCSFGLKRERFCFEPNYSPLDPKILLLKMEMHSSLRIHEGLVPVHTCTPTPKSALPDFLL